ncbi:hypothetical protein BGZ61DRAFT_485664 [Ilyonectria robusta]|uniref:uncharacterized protein n=1 Tax=Ilyonectria robusta TaxID=1079257 RepID=UPI001E8E495B|nr:uncharacterized protein BGZ61DRAFT_485664 [Ilyonectria robusta]KAH8659678.1 hypothetical protein BGZ61DRAFT_485664 [Ilyonectria robusta]
MLREPAKDLLLNKASDGILPSGMGHQHHAIFSRSLEVLSRTLRRDMYSLRAPGLPIDQVSPPDPDPLASTRYPCIYWVDHLGDSNPTQGMRHGEASQNGGVVHTFLRKKYLYWLEALGLLHVRDARRFILSHKRAVEIAPLQVYASALVFSPPRGLVRGLFKEEVPE